MAKIVAFDPRREPLTPTVRTAVLESIGHFQQIAVSRMQVVDVDGVQLLREILGDYSVRLACWIYGREAERVVEYPADWWQALRARWFPRWWLRRHPVVMARVVVRAAALFPELEGAAHHFQIYWALEPEEPRS